MQDVIAALITHYNATSAITDLVSTRIYGGKLPASIIDSMPVSCVVIRYFGGLEAWRTAKFHEPRILIFSYGEDPETASNIDMAVAETMKAIRRTVIGSTMLLSVGISGGPIPGVEPEHGWDYMSRSYTVKAGEDTVT